MSKKPHVALIVGSLRKGSLCRKLAHALVPLAQDALELELLEIRDLPLFDQDLDEETPPSSWVAFRKSIAASDAVLFITPEYNRSVPGGLKNAIDVASRPAGKGVWTGKPGAVISVSPGAMGGFGANHHLRQSLVSIGVPAMAKPEAYIGSADSLFDDEGALKNERTIALLRSFVSSFATFIAANGARGGDAR